MKVKTIGLIILSLLVFFVVPNNLFAHGFGERYDLPIPLDYFIFGAATTVALSFFVIGFFFKTVIGSDDYPRINLSRFKFFRGIALIISAAIKISAVLVLIMVLISGLFDRSVSDGRENFALVFVWIIWWVGLGYITALVGNLWALSNPWQTIFSWFEWVFWKQRSPIFKWPKKLDAWPALVLFLVFAWVENVYTGGSVPFNLAVLIVFYSIVTWCGMFLFGKHIWLKRGDPFSVLFALFARFSPSEIRIVSDGNGNSICQECLSGCAIDPDLPDCVDCYECWEKADNSLKQISLRFWSSGLTRGERVSDALVAFHITALSTVTYDGLSETPFWIEVQNLLWQIVDIIPGNTAVWIESFGTISVPVIFAFMYIQICRWCSRFSSGEMPLSDIVRSFVFSLVPIALAYNFAHYLSYLLISGQSIIPLISDPLFLGWDLFGTVGYEKDISVVDAKFAWIVSIIAIVLGHVISVWIAHKISLNRASSHRIAIRSQYPMLLLMVFYTAVSLWIIAQPIVE